MEYGKYLNLNLPDYFDALDVKKLVENFSKIEDRAPAWTDFSNSGTALETEGNFNIATEFPIGEANQIFSITVKMPRTFAEDDTITVDGVAYTLYQGSDPADSEAFKAGEVVTLNFDKSARRCWAGGGGGVPKPLPAQISNLKGVAVEGETPKIDWTWTNPTDENFSGMVLVVKEGSSPNGPTDGVQVYKGSSTTVTQTEGLQFERTYYARGFAYNSQGKYQMNAEGATATVELSAVPEQVSDVTLTPNKSHATLSWTNPVSTNLQTVKVIQKIGSDPENPNDGTQVYEGTGTTVTVDNLQDSIDYRFGIFAIGKNGKYKAPVVKNYTPAVYPKYTYTGQHTLIKDENDHWRVKLTSSGVIENLGENLKIDIFAVGGGGGGSGQGFGGCGGFTQTAKGVTISKNQRIEVFIGSGGASGYGSTTGPSGTIRGLEGGTSKFGDLCIANGGQGGPYSSKNSPHSSFRGGSGGGAAAQNSSSSNNNAGSGGTDGGNGGSANNTYTDGSGNWTEQGGIGQGSTTREFGEAGADLYAGGGGGGVLRPGSSVGQPGSGGDGSPTLATAGGVTGNVYNSPRGGNPGGGYGGGGGGTWNNSASSDSRYGVGAQGIVIIRDARE